MHRKVLQSRAHNGVCGGSVRGKKKFNTFQRKSVQHPRFPSGHPPQYSAGLTWLNFANRTGYGVFHVEWPYANYSQGDNPKKKKENKNRTKTNIFTSAYQPFCTLPSVLSKRRNYRLLGRCTHTHTHTHTHTRIFGPTKKTKNFLGVVCTHVQFVGCLCLQIADNWWCTYIPDPNRGVIKKAPGLRRPVTLRTVGLAVRVFRV